MNNPLGDIETVKERRHILGKISANRFNPSVSSVAPLQKLQQRLFSFM